MKVTHFLNHPRVLTKKNKLSLIREQNYLEVDKTRTNELRIYLFNFVKSFNFVKTLCTLMFIFKYLRSGNIFISRCYSKVHNFVLIQEIKHLISVENNKYFYDLTTRWRNGHSTGLWPLRWRLRIQFPHMANNTNVLAIQIFDVVRAFIARVLCVFPDP